MTQTSKQIPLKAWCPGSSLSSSLQMNSRAMTVNIGWTVGSWDEACPRQEQARVLAEPPLSIPLPSTSFEGNPRGPAYSRAQRRKGWIGIRKVKVPGLLLTPTVMPMMSLGPQTPQPKECPGEYQHFSQSSSLFLFRAKPCCVWAQPWGPQKGLLLPTFPWSPEL